MSADFDAIVIGSGLGGLTAGALFARSGARVLLLERNSSFGGSATTYRHGALTVEAALHETAPPYAPGGFNRDVFDALGLGEDIAFAPIETLQDIRCPLIGDPFLLPHGFDAAEARLLERFPHQERKIRAFLNQVRRTHQAIEYLSGERSALWRLAHTGGFVLGLWPLLRDARRSLSEVLSRRFGDDEAIKFAVAGNLPYFADDPDTAAWITYVMVQGGFLRGGAGFIKGGSKTLSDRLAEIIREAGGETLTESEAVAIELGAEGEAQAVRYRSASDGAEIVARSAVVFANAAPHVIETMLPADRRATFMAPYRDRPASTSLFSVTIGLNQPPSAFGVSSYSTQLIPAWMERLSDFKHCSALLGAMPAERIPAISVIDYNRIDSGLAAGGVYPMNALCLDRLDNWEGLSDDAYRARKDAWIEALISRLDLEWPGLAAAVVEKTATTARSFHDWLNTPNGAVYGFASRPTTALSQTTATSVKGLWLASAFAGQGGFTGAISCGAAAARAALGAQRS